MSGELTARDVIACAHDFDDWVFGHDRADLVLAALDAAGLEVTEKPNPLLDLRDENGYYLGKQGTTHEHRTVGDYRAWSHDAHEWCYPHDPCHLCKEMAE